MGTGKQAFKKLNDFSNVPAWNAEKLASRIQHVQHVTSFSLFNTCVLTSPRGFVRLWGWCEAGEANYRWSRDLWCVTKFLDNAIYAYKWVKDWNRYLDEWDNTVHDGGLCWTTENDSALQVADALQLRTIICVTINQKWRFFFINRNNLRYTKCHLSKVSVLEKSHYV